MPDLCGCVCVNGRYLKSKHLAGHITRYSSNRFPTRVTRFERMSLFDVDIAKHIKNRLDSGQI